MKPRKFNQVLKQPMPEELTDACLDFLRRKFYAFPGGDRAFFQQRRDLLRRVVWWPASWLNKRGVTIHGDLYRQIFMQVFLQAAAHVQTKVKYPPAYLAQVIESHFAIHGEEYYEEAKSVRALVEQTLLVAGQLRPPVPDPVRELANARKIITAGTPKKRVSQAPVKSQLNLFA